MKELYKAIITINDRRDISLTSRVKFLHDQLGSYSQLKESIKKCEEMKSIPLETTLTEEQIRLWNDNGFDVEWNCNEYLELHERCHPLSGDGEHLKDLVSQMSTEEKEFVEKIMDISDKSEVVTDYLRAQFTMLPYA